MLNDIGRWIAVHTQNFLMMRHDGSNSLKPDTFGAVHRWPHLVVTEGDFMETGEPFLKKNQHLVVALLHLDFDLYEPTKHAINLFLPRMPKGAIIAFDEIDHPDWPGETLALLETIGVRNLQLKRISFEPTMAYAVLT